MRSPIRILWPPSRTSANASRQGDWRGKAKAAQSYKAECAWEILAQRVEKIPIDRGAHVPVTITYHPPRNMRVDWDNLANACRRNEGRFGKKIIVWIHRDWIDGQGELFGGQG